MLASAVLLALLHACTRAFELGRYDAGFRVVDSVRGALTANARIRALQAENEKLHSQLEAAQVARSADNEGYALVQRSLGDMQSQIARLNQDLSFYRGLVQPETLIHVKVQQMQIVPQAAAGQFQLKFVLMQTGKPDKGVSGNVVIYHRRHAAGQAGEAHISPASPSHRASLAYSFKYFQEYAEPIVLPQGFEPTRVGVEIYSSKDAAHSFRQAFTWKAQGMSVETEAPTARFHPGVGQMFKQKSNSKARIDTLIGAKTRITGDVEFVGGFHIDGYIKGNVKCGTGGPGGSDVLSVSEAGCIEGSVVVPNIVLNGIVKGDIEASGRVEMGPRAQVLGSVQYTTIETAVGARITGKLIHSGKRGPGTTDPDGSDTL